VDKAKDIINKLVEVYNVDAVNDKNAESRKTAEFIEERIANVGRDLGNVEAKKEQFKKANQITDLNTEARIGLETSADARAKQLEIASQLELTNSLISFVSRQGNYQVIPNNISFGVEGATDKQIEDAAKIANAYDFISQSENGFDTNIGDRGNRLSGGQRQRVSIARAILKNPPILILDEATSALDTESERLVQDALERLMKTRTTVAIAHRLSTIKNADEICVLHEGQIVERGTHQELLDKDGYYKKLHDMQS
jgi:ABC-type transport system involved in Fe-S cluster assembly fused permease/ATPase subunit